MQKRVLVTGGKGFIGRHLIPHLYRLGFEIHIATLTPGSLNDADISYHTIDLLNEDAQRYLMNEINPTHLLHLAWYTENGKFWDAIQNVHWLKATISLAETFYQQGGKRLVGIGTCAEYDWQEGNCIEEITPDKPTSLYGKNKKSAYDCLHALAKFHGTSFAWARIFFPYGPSEAKQRLIPYVINCLLQNQEAKCTHGNQVRDFLYVKDIAQALSLLLNADIEGIINIGSGLAISIRDIILTIANKLNRAELIKFGAIADPAYSPPRIVANISRLQNELNWTPSFTLEQGLLETIHWWQHETNMEIKHENRN